VAVGHGESLLEKILLARARDHGVGGESGPKGCLANYIKKHHEQGALLQQWARGLL